MRFVGTGLVVCSLVFYALAAASFAQESLALNQAMAAYEELDEWLGDSENSNGWRKHLKSDELQKQFDLGRKADLETVQEIIASYGDGSPGLALRQFVTVRQALVAWERELSSPGPDELVDLAEAAAAEARPVEAARLTQAKSQAGGALRLFEFFIGNGGPARERGWRKFLRLDDYKEEMSSDDPDLNTLTQVWAIFAGDEQGLDHPRFAAVRESLRQYIAAAQYFENEQSDFARLPEALKNHQADPSQDTAADLGSLLGWLDRTSQQRELRDAVGYHYLRPNLYVQASEKLVIAGFEDKIDRERDINTNQNGQVTGTETTKADVKGELVRNLRRGEVRVSMSGTTDTETARRTNGVTINSTAKTNTNASKPIYFTPDGIVGGQSSAKSLTDIEYGEITGSNSQIRDAVQRQVTNNVERDEQQAARRADAQARAELNGRVAESLEDANDQMKNDVLMPLVRHGAEPRRLDYTSTEDYLHATVVQATKDELAADSDPPAPVAEGDLVGRIHESWLNNVGTARFRGVLLTDVGLAKWLEEERGEVPEDLQVGPDTDPWDLTFHSRRPLSYEVTPEELKVTLRGIRFTARDRKMNEGMHVIATYKVAKAGGRAKLVRQGDLEIKFPEQEGKRLTVRYIAMKKFWATKFKSLFEDEITELPIELEGAWADAGELEWTDIELGKDWVTLRWDLVEKAGEETAAVSE